MFSSTDVVISASAFGWKVSSSKRNLQLSAQRNETETKQFHNSFGNVLFTFSFISLCGQFQLSAIRMLLVY